MPFVVFILVCSVCVVYSAKRFTLFLDGTFFTVDAADVAALTGRTLEEHIGQGEAVAYLLYVL